MLTETRVREILREELAAALSGNQACAPADAAPVHPSRLHMPARQTPEEMRLAVTQHGARWTVSALAAAVGVRPETLRRIERGQFTHQRESTWATVDRIAQALGVSKVDYRHAVMALRNQYLEQKGV